MMRAVLAALLALATPAATRAQAPPSPRPPAAAAHRWPSRP